uniref:Uncharacterized protein n=1 Tax=viral metagenome TaxID=1070528 RepID=A0A6C0HVF9_9ZZZZ
MSNSRNFYSVKHYPAEYTKKCFDNNITDFKTCIEYHKFKNENLFTDKIKERFEHMEQMKPLIKTCIDKNIEKNSCYYSKNKNDYNFELAYFNEFNILFDKMKQS